MFDYLLFVRLAIRELEKRFKSEMTFETFGIEFTILKNLNFQLIEKVLYISKEYK